MKKIAYVFDKLADKSTWQKAFYFMMRKNIEEAKRPLTVDDIIPILLAFVISIGIIIFVFYLTRKIFYYFHLSNKIGDPICLQAARDGLLI